MAKCSVALFQYGILYVMQSILKLMEIFSLVMLKRNTGKPCRHGLVMCNQHLSSTLLCLHGEIIWSSNLNNHYFQPKHSTTCKEDETNLVSLSEQLCIHFIIVWSDHKLKTQEKGGENPLFLHILPAVFWEYVSELVISVTQKKNTSVESQAVNTLWSPLKSRGLKAITLIVA